jgi:AbrB family looped-hinge helix DNA binding protein
MEQVSRGKVHAGRVVLPAEMRKELGIKDGDDVVFNRTERGIEIQTYDEVVRQAQEYFSSLAPAGVSLSEELLRDRRAEAKRDERD